MSENAIVVENLSKRYLIGHRFGSGSQYKYTALRDVISREVRTFARKAADVVRGRQVVQGDEIEEFWALRGVNLEVKQGEALGIIGRNGAGKSTLLKILSRITEPTEGRVLLRGRISTLLEVGTGFHPELTGRENIFLNGAILGMTQREILGRFDEIVAFADVETFLDTPVKHYSSGMHVRLAFAVAAHLESEIMVVDEVLAVGDAEFQKKCLGKMDEVSRKEGKTILFVSHNMEAILRLTKRSVLLRNGAMDFIGPTDQTIQRYLAAHHEAGQTRFDVAKARRQYQGTGDVRILALWFNRATPRFEFGEPISYIVSVRADRAVRKLRVGMTIFARDGAAVGSAFSPEIDGLSAGMQREVIVTVPFDRLAPGAYYCGISIGCGNNQSTYLDYDAVLDTLHFEVSSQNTADGFMASWVASWGSVTLPDLRIEPLAQQLAGPGNGQP
jgi:lipopolysaccharide transport system ATP-binding protein